MTAQDRSSDPAGRPTRRTNLLFAAGIALGLALAWLGYTVIAASPSRLEMPDRRNHRLSDAEPGNGVSISFVTTGTARPPGRRLSHGFGLRRADVAFRAAIIDHPDGRILFGTGVDPDGPEGLVFNPFGRITPVDLPDIGDVDEVIVPTPRWIHMGGLDQWEQLADATVRAGNGDFWQARSGPWPRRYGMESDEVRALGRRAQSVGWQRTRKLGSRQSRDWFRDGSVVLLQLRGSTIDEVALLVTVDSGERHLLVGDAVWTRAQVEELFPRAPWSTWLWDRNRMQLAGTQTQLHSLWRDGGINVIPLLDGSMDLPEYPDALR